ncbi:MAG TPA: hypothetical protein VGS22_25070 [Thermoanaerobaculia bacterium]|jgi:hypothetical protein|nr:hypothetical protein [Thermoanaerobaculia bacterium]
MDFLRDFRLAAENAGRTPGFSVAMVATLAFGIGSCSRLSRRGDRHLEPPFAAPDAGGVRGRFRESVSDFSSWDRQRLAGAFR